MKNIIFAVVPTEALKVFDGHHMVSMESLLFFLFDICMNNII
jgi:hypothetical protein